MPIDFMEIALRIRTKLESVPFCRELNCCSVLEKFPKNCCQVSALLCLSYFKKNRIADSKKMYLLANAEITAGASHAWAFIDDYHIDLTADQFSREKVIVTKADPWPGILKKPDYYPFDKEWLMKDYEADLLRLCHFIDA